MTTNILKLFEGVDEVCNGKEKVNLQSALRGKEVLGLYFSAHWCPPCRGFTPNLVAAYNDLKADNKPFEIIFCSSDSDDTSFQNYYDEMPWLALPFSEKDVKTSLSKKYGCKGIPYLVLLDCNTGEEITRDGRAVIDDCPTAFPFTDEAIEEFKDMKNKSIIDVFKDWKIFESYVDSTQLSNNEAVAVFIGCANNNAKYVSPELTEASKKLGDRLGVVYIPYGAVSGDEQTKFVAAMPANWTIIGEADVSAIVDAIKAVTDVDDVTTIIITRDNKVVEDASREIYNNEDFGFPWTPAALKKATLKKKAIIEEIQKTKLNCPGLKFLEDANIINKEGVKVPLENLVSIDLVGIYFSAHWCGPCQAFTPKLAEVYDKLKKDGKNIEVVFISSDSGAKEFQGYFNDMPWIAVDYEQRELQRTLSEVMDVSGIPTLIWINPCTGEMITDGRQTVLVGADYYPWDKEAIEEGKAMLALKEAEAREEERQKTLQVQKEFHNAGTVVVKDYIGKGQMTADYTLTFGDFNTFIGDVKLPIADDAKYYYEVEVKNIASVQQFGWMTEGFQSAERSRGEGVGDDNYSWGIDGVRTSKWGINGGGEDDNDDSDDNFGGQWTEGDVLGFAADMTTAGNVTLSFSHNGSFDTPYGVAFKKLSVQWLSPALTAQSGVYQVNFGDRPFKFAPPDESYASVHDYAKI